MNRTAQYSAVETALLNYERIYNIYHSTPRELFQRRRIVREEMNIARLEYHIAQAEAAMRR